MTAEALTSSRLVPVIPDGGWGWAVVVGSFFIHVIADGFVYSFGVLVEILMQEFDSDNTLASLIISILTGLTLGSGPLASAVCNKFGCRVTTIIGACVAILGCTASIFATAMWHIVFTVGVIMGIGFGLMYCPAIVIVTMYFEKRRSLATGIAVSGAGIGTLLFSPVNEFIVRHMGWRSVFITFIGALGFCILCGWSFKPLPFLEVEEHEEADGTREMKKTEVVPASAERGALHSAEMQKSDTRTATTTEGTTLLSSGMQSTPGSPRAMFLPSSKMRSTPASPRAMVLPSSAIRSTPTTPRRRAGKSATDPNSSDEEEPPIGRRRCGTIGELDVGYVNRKDVFYTGTITNVAEYKKYPDKYRSTGSLLVPTVSVASTDVAERSREIREAIEQVSGSTEDDVGGKNMFKTISKMLSLSLLIDPTFLLFAISNLLTSVGFNSPLYFLPLHAIRGVGLDSASSSKILSSFGLCNTVGRVVFGMVADRRLPLPYGLGDDIPRNRLWIYNLSLSLCGTLTIFCYLCNGFISLSIYAGLFGFTISAYVCLTSVLLVDLLGLAKLTNAFGLLLLWQGVGTIFGPPIAGILADITNTYVWSFVFCGINLLISGLMLFCIPCIQKRKKNEEDLPEELPKQKKQKD
ncbi:transporter, major facilitator family protein [Ancylostoma caninum]|uniref:Transporter, major facilitator family protein n=1 Tax=Ancylostoma caninum TaxID=29170 RepID=A0A368H9I7_ANCCA|nr:transporter, major facilitator family protein [Ancylostoma caninum]